MNTALGLLLLRDNAAQLTGRGRGSLADVLGFVGTFWRWPRLDAIVAELDGDGLPVDGTETVVRGVDPARLPRGVQSVRAAPGGALRLVLPPGASLPDTLPVYREGGTASVPVSPAPPLNGHASVWVEAAEGNTLTAVWHGGEGELLATLGLGWFTGVEDRDLNERVAGASLGAWVAAQREAMAAAANVPGWSIAVR